MKLKLVHNRNNCDAPVSFLMDSIVSPKVKTMEGEGVEVCSLARNTSRVEGHTKVSGWGLGRLTINSITHTVLAQTKQQIN